MKKKERKGNHYNSIKKVARRNIIQFARNVKQVNNGHVLVSQKFAKSSVNVVTILL